MSITYNGVEIRGLKELDAAIRETYSTKIREIRKQAINAGGDIMVKRLKEEFDRFKKTGYSEDEIMRSDARTKGDVAELKVGWNGPHDRWRLIHLNEFGYTRKGKQYTPRGFGAIQKTIGATEDEYVMAVWKEMAKHL